MNTLLEKHWHHLPKDELLDLLDTEEKTGLDRFEVEDRQAQFGPNILTQHKGHGPLVRFLLQFHQALVYILLGAVVIKLMLGAWVDASVIFGVVLLNSIIGFVQEGKALNALAALSRALTTTATVLRGGEKQQIDARELVPGDIVIIASGDKVPADLRLLQSRNLQIDESALTGESVPVEKQAGELAHDVVLAERTNMAYSSSLVTYGTGVGVVTATGDCTEMGRISELIASAEVLATPLTRKIARFSHVLLYAILVLAVLTFGVGLWHGGSAVDLFMAAVALAVAMIPEGLPAVLTITLAIGVARMARRHAIIRHLPAVETLGSTTVICSDKTGTLTRNEMTVQRLWAGNQHADVSGVGYAPEGELRLDGKTVDIHAQATLGELLRAGVLCNDSVLKKNDGGWWIEGDPTEGALLVAAAKAGFDLPKLHETHPRLDAVPFESQHQYMATLHDGDEAVVYLKGSVESVLERCEAMLGADGEPVPLDGEEIHRQVLAMASQGQRVLAFARLAVPAGTTSIDHQRVAAGLVFLGLQGMIDPPREEAIRSVQACQAAGIQVKMITGDHAATAAAIAAQIGLGGPVPEGRMPDVLTGRDLEKMSDAELITAATETEVFARVTPEQKLRLVEALQAHGEVTAMTGDGVNDAPSLQSADIGVAMGISGTDVAKGASDMVLTDDNFSTIVKAVEEGRNIFNNLKKTITFLLSCNAGEIVAIFTAILFGWPPPLRPTHILWVNLITDTFPALALGVEPPDPDVMEQPPRNPKESLFAGGTGKQIILNGLLIGALTLGIYSLGRVLYPENLVRAQTLAFGVLSFAQLFHAFNLRHNRKSIFTLGVAGNPYVFAALATGIFLQIFIISTPGVSGFFKVVPLSLFDWMIVFAFSLVPIAVNELVKIFLRAVKKGAPNHEKYHSSRKHKT